MKRRGFDDLMNASTRQTLTYAIVSVDGSEQRTAGVSGAVELAFPFDAGTGGARVVVVLRPWNRDDGPMPVWSVLEVRC